MNFPFYIARRYLFAKKSHNVINVISAISATGLAIGTAALVLIMSVYNGFDGIISQSLSELTPDIKIVPAQGKCFVPQGEDFDNIRSLDGLRTCSEVVEENVFLNYAGRQAVAFAKGVDSVFVNTSALNKHVIEGNLELYHGDLPQCCIGAGLSYSLCAHPRFSDRMTLYYPIRGENISLSNPMESLSSVSLFPGGVVTFDIETDNKLLILPLDLMRKLVGYKSEVSCLELDFAPDVNLTRVSEKIANEIGPDYKVLDRYSQNPDLYKVMKYEKLAIFAILIFVIILIAFNVFGSLSMLIIEKKDDISTLKALGADSSTIRKIFVLEGWLVSLCGMVIGLALGLLLALLQQNLGIIKMPGNYLVDAYPVVVNWGDVLWTVVGVAVIGYLIALIARPRTS